MRQFTKARIGIGRSGVAVPTSALLDFQLAAARARDAVHAELDVASILEVVAPSDYVLVASQAENRAAYLLRPDLGRRLTPQSAAQLKDRRRADGHEYDLVFVIADGLSARAAMRHAPDVVALCRNELRDLAIGPLVIARQARVALADDVGVALAARMVMILLGERPGLSTAESLGVYFTWKPTIGTPDSKRNCISNIHDAGLSYQAAARMAGWLVREACRLKLSGVGLKENAPGSISDDSTPSLPAPILSRP